MLKLDYNTLATLVPEGTYEVLVNSAYFNVTPGGKDFFQISHVIRNDVDQPQKDRILSDSIFALNSDKAVAFRVNNISRAAGLSNGMEFANLDEWGAAVTGKALCVTVKHSQYNGKTYANISRYEKTRHPELKHISKEKPPAPGPVFEDVELSEEEIPF